VLKMIEKAMRSNRQLEVLYMSGSGQITKRWIKVLTVNTYYFVAYCFLRRSTRTFNLNNVLACVPIV